MSLVHIAELREAASRSDDVDDHERLAHAEVAYMAVQRERVHAAQVRLLAAQQRKRELLAALATTQATTTTRTAGTTTTTHAPPCDTSSSSSHKDGDDDHKSMLNTYHHEWLRWLRVLTTRKEVLSYVLAYSAADMRVADITVVSRWLDTWGAFFREAKAALKALKLQAHALHTRAQQERDEGKDVLSSSPAAAAAVHDVPPVQTLYDALDAVCRLQLQARSLIGRERYRRSAASEEAVKELTDSAAQLVEWCEAQSSTLDSLTRLADVQPFATSLAANVQVMSSNFLVLMEQAEPVATHVRVLPALHAANAAWTRLCVQTYRAMRAAVVDAHTHSCLEALCDVWLYGSNNNNNATTNSSGSGGGGGSHATRLRTTTAGGGSGVAAAHELLTLSHSMLEADERDGRCSHDSGSGSSATQRQQQQMRAQLRTQCAALRSDAAAHTTLCTHLSNFTLREACVRPHMDALCGELVSDTATTVLCFADEDVASTTTTTMSATAAATATTGAVAGDAVTTSTAAAAAAAAASVDTAAAAAEMRNRMEELREWVEVKSQKGTYLRLLERLEDTQHLIEDYADVLFPDKEDDDDEAAVGRTDNDK